ncbi:MAG TPA: hypothetical protein VGR72_07260 [Candidatus Acidoferrales bacterium]|nr:hypothetical protein [Candidatus Acidoferrales bacterium]
MRAWWKQFYEINKSIFRLTGDDFSYFTIVGLVAIVGDVLAAFSSIYVRFLRFAVALLISDTTLRGRVLAEPVFGHGGFRFTFMLLVMMALYLALYVARAPGVLARRATQISSLERDKQALLPRVDFRDQLAAAVGVSFTSIKRIARVTGYEGNAEMRQEETFVVSNLRLQDLVRRVGSDCKINRHDPVIEVVGLPRGIRPTKKYKDLQSEPGTREYTVCFDPPLERMNAPATLLIREEMDRVFYLCWEDVPGDWPRSDRAEYMGHLVYEPTEQLSLLVEFPLGYDPPQESVSIRVNYARGETRHLDEELRLAHGQALRIRRNSDGAAVLSLDIKKPLLGLTYMLCSKPLSKSQVDALKERFAPARPAG